MAEKKRPYKESCARAAQLLAEGKSPWQAAQTMTTEACWSTSTGLTRWQRSSATVAARRGAEMAALGMHVEAAAEAAAAPAPNPEQAPMDALPVAREPRRPLKRMLTAEQWESMPEGMQQAVVRELLARLG